MKNYTLKLSTILIAVLLFLVGCQKNPDTRVVLNAKSFNVDWNTDIGGSFTEQFAIVEIDSCEYLVGQYDRSRFVTHKGNCKFCINRLKNK